MKTSQVLTIAGLLAVAPGVANATIYITNPTSGGNAIPGPQTHLFSIEEDGTGLTNLGFVTLDGADARIGSIAMNATGVLYGFVYDADAEQSVLATIDPDTLEATVVGAGTPTPGLITGAGFDRLGRLWVYDRTDQTVYEYDPIGLVALGTPFGIPNPADTDGGDLAFDLDGNCYFQGTFLGNTSTPFYSCDLDDGTFVEIGTWTQSGSWSDDGLSMAGLSYSLDPATCEPVLIASEGFAVDDLALLNVDSLTAEHIVSTEVNISWYNHVDVAGFPSIAQVAACDFCGDGVLDPGEECDDGNLVDGDGCSAVCLVDEVVEPEPCVKTKKNWYFKPKEYWPVDSLEYYNWTWEQHILRAFLGWHTDDASVLLMKQVIALDLNAAAGVDVSSMMDTRYDALYLLWFINIGFNPEGEDAEAALALAWELAEFNGGHMGPPSCY